MGRDVGPLPVPTGTVAFREGSAAADAAHGCGSSFMACCEQLPVSAEVSSLLPAATEAGS